jgi:transducin (beta)-like 1
MERPSISSSELNLLVYRYLVESGFSHSAYVLATESLVGETSAATASIPPGALIGFVHKGIQYAQLEREIKEELTSNKIGQQQQSSTATTTSSNNNNNSLLSLNNSLPSSKRTKTVLGLADKGTTILRGHLSSIFVVRWSPVEDILASGAGDSARIWRDQQQPFLLLHGGGSSSNSNIPNGFNHSSIVDSISQHPPDNNDTNQKEVLCLGWSFDGKFVATGASDGIVRLWGGSDGSLLRPLQAHHHTNPNTTLTNNNNNFKSSSISPFAVYALNWSMDNTLILSGGGDGHIMVWDITKSKIVFDEDVLGSSLSDSSRQQQQQQQQQHQCRVNDVQWRRQDNSICCAGLSNGGIVVCNIENTTTNPIYFVHDVHSDEVNCMDWSYSGTMFASGSDDTSVKIYLFSLSTTTTTTTITTTTTTAAAASAAPNPTTSNKESMETTTSIHTTNDVVDDSQNTTNTITTTTTTSQPSTIPPIDDANSSSVDSSPPILSNNNTNNPVPMSDVVMVDSTNHSTTVPTILPPLSSNSSASSTISLNNNHSTSSSQQQHQQVIDVKLLTTLKGHSKPVYCVRWCPLKTPGTITSSSRSTNNTSNTVVALATCSGDGCVRLWSIDEEEEEYTCTHTFSKFTEMVYTLQFDPQGDFLCAGGYDGFLHVLRATDLSLAKSMKTNEAIFDVSWNHKGDKIAIGTSEGSVIVFDW